MVPIRVLQSVSYMGHGGIEHFVLNVYRHIDRSRVQFDFMYRISGPALFDDEIRGMGARIYHCASPDAHPVRSKRFYRTFFRQHPEYRVVHEHRSSLYGFMGCVRAAAEAGVPTRVVHAHNSSSNRTGLVATFEKLTTNFNERDLASMATDFFACSKPAAEWMFPSSTGVSNRVRIVPNAIDAEGFHFDEGARRAVRDSLGIPPDAFVIGNVGRFAWAKNQAFLVDTLASFDGDSRPYLLLVGEGELKESVQQKATEMGVSDRVIFAGARNDTDRIYSAMDVLCMPSLHEGLPVTTVEAQASGLPLLLSDAVPRDCDLGGRVTFKPLGDGAPSWGRELSQMRVSTGVRASGVEVVTRAGFDVSTVARELQDFYLSRYEEGVS